MREIDQLVNMLGMAKRAGALVAGFDTVVAEMQKGRINKVFVAADISAKTKKEVAFFAGKHEVQVVPIAATMDDIYTRLGRKVGVLGLTQEGFADRVEELARVADGRNVDDNTI